MANFDKAVWYGKATGFYYFDFLNEQKQWEKRFADTEANLALIAEAVGKELAFNYAELQGVPA